MAIKEVTKETEFDEGWNSTDTPASKEEEVATENKPAVSEEKPVAKEEEEKEIVAAEEGPEAKADESVKDEKAEIEKPAQTIDTDKEATYEQRWKSSQGIVKSEMTKRAEAERLLAEKEAEIAKLKAEREKPDEKVAEETSEEINKLEDQYIDAIMEDDRTLAKKIRSQIDDLKTQKLRESLKKETSEEVNLAISQQEKGRKINEIVQNSIAKYPFLNHTDEKKGNPYAIRLVRATRDEYMSQGMGFIEALETAVAEVAPMFEKAKKVEKVIEEPVDKDKVLPTIAVETKNTPVKTGGKPKGLQTFDDGWNSFGEK